MARELIQNPSFEAGTEHWTFTPGSGPVTNLIVPAHTGTTSGALLSINPALTPSILPPPEVSQFIPGPLAPFSLLRLSFYANFSNPPTEVSATVTLYAGLIPLPGIVIHIPPGSNVISFTEYEYYEGYSQPLPPGITGALVKIGISPSTFATASIAILVDDISLTEDVL
ncbi:MAG: hypothetical protein FH756_14435 [Firmicutes bacterium]|nr:hypothetical protein [Bacillota bacterium]